MYVLFLRDRHKMPRTVKMMGLILAQGSREGFTGGQLDQRESKL